MYLGVSGTILIQYDTAVRVNGNTGSISMAPVMTRIVQCKGKKIWPPKPLTKQSITTEVEKLSRSRRR